MVEADNSHHVAPQRAEQVSPYHYPPFGEKPTQGNVEQATARKGLIANEKLLQLIRVYFSRGGQEIQINSTSREVLEDAMNNPDKYPSLVVRVSGFSAIYVTLEREVQEDILSRTQQEAV